MADIEIFKQLKNQLTENQNEEEYHSDFKFEAYVITEEEKNYIIEKEKILFKRFKAYSENLYEICKALYDVRQKLKKYGDYGEMTFTDWYKFIGLNKDKVSELTKRYELYMLAPDKKAHISSLSIPVVKLLTKKAVDVEIREKILELELKKVEDIVEIIGTPEIIEKPKELQPHIKKTCNFFKKRIEKATSLKELVKEKENISALIKELKELQKEIEQEEKTRENENNLQLPTDAEIVEEKIVSHFYKDEDESIYLIDSCDDGEGFCIVRYPNLKSYLDSKNREQTTLITSQKTYDEAHQLLIELANKLNYTPVDIKEETNGF